MEKFYLEQDVHLICVAASTFPEGISAAYEQLHTLLPPQPARNIYGISWGDPDGLVIYKAAAEQIHPGEAEQLGFEAFTLRKGEYLGVVITNFMEDIPRMGATFRELIANPLIDPNGICVEMYLGEKDVRCMVRLK
jgi:hypothetical protein